MPSITGMRAAPRRSTRLRFRTQGKLDIIASGLPLRRALSMHTRTHASLIGAPSRGLWETKPQAVPGSPHQGAQAFVEDTLVVAPRSPRIERIDGCESGVEQLTETPAGRGGEVRERGAALARQIDQQFALESRVVDDREPSRPGRTRVREQEQAGRELLQGLRPPHPRNARRPPRKRRRRPRPAPEWLSARRALCSVRPTLSAHHRHPLRVLPARGRPRTPPGSEPSPGSTRSRGWWVGRAHSTCSPPPRRRAPPPTRPRD